VALIEAAVLTGREGEVFPGVVVDISRRDGRGEVVIHEPAVRGRVSGADLPRVSSHDVDAYRQSITKAMRDWGMQGGSQG
jgi:RNase II-type exonuclease C-terminal S1 domain